MLTLTVLCPNCGEEVWDTSHIDQALNKCWSCGQRWLTDIVDEEEAR